MTPTPLQEWMTGICKQLTNRLNAGGALIALADTAGQNLQIAAQYTIRPSANMVGRWLPTDQCGAARFVLQSRTPLSLAGKNLACQMDGVAALTGFTPPGPVLLVPLDRLENWAGCVLIWQGSQKSFQAADIYQAARAANARPPLTGSFRKA